MTTLMILAVTAMASVFALTVFVACAIFLFACSMSVHQGFGSHRDTLIIAQY